MTPPYHPILPGTELKFPCELRSPSGNWDKFLENPGPDLMKYYDAWRPLQGAPDGPMPEGRPDAHTPPSGENLCNDLDHACIHAERSESRALREAYLAEMDKVVALRAQLSAAQSVAQEGERLREALKTVNSGVRLAMLALEAITLDGLSKLRRVPNPKPEHLYLREQCGAARVALDRAIEALEKVGETAVPTPPEKPDWSEMKISGRTWCRKCGTLHPPGLSCPTTPPKGTSGTV